MTHFLLLTGATLISCSAISITLDYSHDTFFAGNATAKASLEAAASDISNAISSSLGAITTDVYTGNNGSTTAILDWSLGYTNPSTGAAESLGTFSLGADEVRIYVGMQNLAGNTLGEGGPGGSGISFGGGGSSSEWVGAMANAESASNTAMGRGSLVTLGGFSGSIDLGGTSASYNLTYGPTIGNLWFDSDTDNNGVTDDAATLASEWHFNHTTAVTAGKSDFYSVALHEILHAVGHTDGYDSFDALATGANWAGANVIAELGTGTGVLHTDGVHFAAGTMSATLDGVAQEAVMDPNLTVGTRKYLTTLDLALLSDMGWDVIPEPSTGALFCTSFLFLLKRKRR